MDAQDKNISRMLWLSGPAGAGKTAIMQTVAERSAARGVPHANFFFFRSDSSRSDATALVPTLLHQIIQIYPSVGDAVAAALASNSILFRMGLQQQFDALMHLPLTAIQISSSTRRPVVLLIDGLDECYSESKMAQRKILQALDTLLITTGDSFRVVVASRVEPHIATAFSQLRSQVDSIFLDEKYSPETDIRLFVTTEFNKIKSTHHLAHTLDQNWPSDPDVDDIVNKSSGQFIYAATVMRFIAYSPSSPILSLQKVQGIVPPARNSPFAQLDAVYSYILEQVDDLDAVMSILASSLVARDLQAKTIKACLKAYDPRYSDELDKSRAGRFYIDLEAFSAAIFLKLCDTADWNLTNVSTFAISAFQQIRRPTPDISPMFINTDLTKYIGEKAQARTNICFVLRPRHFASYDDQSSREMARKLNTEFKNWIPPSEKSMLGLAVERGKYGPPNHIFAAISRTSM
ncbi:hypothetical protein D9619_011080 [Psilocybe cf. subviscida]|uniref:NACHT domain-containing protein n=1 Tax=Psilocybe cf. subviscida TaxID=2480587 RepID=A0A8H5BKR8_9AGAR|nr:hypothetical protein D9619_011080 [Psilocybe cf. subviscida]